MAINLHPSLLPRYAGRCPAEWTILNGESQTGVTLIQMTKDFDAGPILAQKSLNIDSADTRETLYGKLYTLGAEMLVSTLPLIVSGQIQPHPQPGTDKLYARQITRLDGFIPYDQFSSQLTTHNSQLKTKFRALAGWPGIWTTDPAGKRLKLVSLTPPMVQFEGKTPMPWLQS
jgi:methionyl-tRNA formyltransferase